MKFLSVSQQVNKARASPSPPSSMDKNGEEGDHDTSSMPQAHSSSMGEVELAISDVELLRIMECPVCNEFPLPPIYSCGKGHFTCNSCMKLLDTCPLCQSPFTGVRNFALESIIENSKFKCRNSPLGCSAILFGAELAHHVIACKFRPLDCTEPRCLKSSLSPSEYLLHMQYQHGLTGCYRQLEHGKTSVLIKQNEGDGEFVPFFIKLLSSGKNTDGTTLIIMTERYRTFMCWWSVCLEPANMSTYHVQLSLEGKTKPRQEEQQPEQVLSICWNFPPQPIWKSFDEIRDTGHCAVLPKTNLLPFYEDEKSWSLKVEVVEKETENKKMTRTWLGHYYPLFLLILVGTLTVLLSIIVEYGMTWCGDPCESFDWNCNDNDNDTSFSAYVTTEKQDLDDKYVGYRGFYYKK